MWEGEKNNSHSLDVDFEDLIPKHYLLVVYVDFKDLILLLIFGDLKGLDSKTHSFSC